MSTFWWIVIIIAIILRIKPLDLTTHQTRRLLGFNRMELILIRLCLALMKIRILP